VLLGLGDGDAKDTILEASAHSVLVDSGREIEGARELAERSLGEPILGVVDWLLLGLLLKSFLLWVLKLGDLRSRLVSDRFILFLDGSLMAAGLALLAVLGDGAAHRSVLDELAVGRGGVVGALRLAANEQGLGLGELDMNILLSNAGKLAVEFVEVSRLADIKLWLPSGYSSSSLSLARVVVKVVEKTEERSEGGVGVVESSREEGHFDSVVGDRFRNEVVQVVKRYW